MGNATRVSSRSQIVLHDSRHVQEARVTPALLPRRAGWFPRVKHRTITPPDATRHDLIAWRKAREAQAFCAYAHGHGRKEYERGEYERAAQWQRLGADATRGAIMYRELARMLFSADTGRADYDSSDHAPEQFYPVTRART